MAQDKKLETIMDFPYFVKSGSKFSIQLPEGLNRYFTLRIRGKSGEGYAGAVEFERGPAELKGVPVYHGTEAEPSKLYRIPDDMKKLCIEKICLSD